MIVALSIYFLSQAGRRAIASPVNSTFSSSNDQSRMSNNAGPASAGVPFDSNYRSTTDILWNCLGTIFICTWLSVHPNVAGYKSTYCQRFRYRLELMLWALIAPELVILWAHRQWLGARNIARLLNSDANAAGEWTTVHGHFLQMGGFIFADRKGRTRYIKLIGISGPEGKFWLRKKLLHDITTLKISAEEIFDRSKGDEVSKACLIIQSVWFVTQCISRGAQGLHITELEIVTLAYAVLNGIMYFFWWDKPLDVQCPIVVHESSDSEAFPADFESKDDTIGTVFAGPGPKEGEVGGSWPSLALEYLSQWFRCVLNIKGKLSNRMMDIAESRNSTEISSGATSVPTFYAFDTSFEMENMVQVFAAVLASVFGAIHCAALFGFSVKSEKTVWAVSAIYICISPMVVIPIRLYGYFMSLSWVEVPDGIPTAIRFSMNAVYTLLLPYIPLRIILLVLSLLELRQLPHSAHETVDWTSFIPHI